MTVSSLVRLVSTAAVAAMTLAACAAPLTSSSTPSKSVAKVSSSSISPTKAQALPTVGGATGTGCAAAGLRVQQASKDGAAGHIHFVIALTNTAATTCTLSGYPSLEMLDRAGNPMLTRISHSDVSFPPTPPHRVLLAPRGSASFDVGYSHVPVGSEPSCPAASAVLVRVTTDGKGLRLSQSMDPCNRGAIAISALTAGLNGTRG